MYYSNNYGVNWARVSGFQYYYFNAGVSGDGTRVTIANEGGYIYYSANFGTTAAPTFAASTTYFGNNWYGISISNTGLYQAVSYLGGGIVWSSNSGVTFSNPSAPGGNIYSVSMSPSGVYAYFVIYGGTGTSSGLYYSTSTGAAGSFVQNTAVAAGNYATVNTQDNTGTCIVFAATSIGSVTGGNVVSFL